MYCEIDIGVVMGEEFNIYELNDVVAPWSDHMESSGAGFGVRDMQFTYVDEVRAHVEYPKLVQAIRNAGFELEYFGIEQQPETVEDMRELGWPEEDIKDYFREVE